jgi:hypothetical protein
MKNNKFSKKDIVLKTSIIFDSILNLENKIGILLPQKDLLKQIKEDAKRYNEKISIAEAKEIIYIMLLTGVVFYPKKNYVTRITAYKESTL